MNERDRHTHIEALEVLGRQFSRLADADADADLAPSRRLGYPSTWLPELPLRAWLSSAQVRAALILSLVALVAAFGALTPPGRAIAEKIAELAGIGESPTLEEHLPGESAPGRPAVVVGNGHAPDGTGYEIVAYESRASGTCVALEWPDQHRTSGVCSGGQPLSEGVGAVRFQFPTAQLPTPPLVTVAGSAGPEVREVRAVEISDGVRRRIAVDFVALSQGPAGVAEVEDRMGYFVAFLSDEVSEPDVLGARTEIEIVAYDGRGEALGGRTVSAQALAEEAPGPMRDCERAEPGQPAPPECEGG